MLFRSGAGAASRQAIGWTVLSGMLAATVLGIALVPGLYALFQTLREKASALRARWLGRGAAKGAAAVLLLCLLAGCKAAGPDYRAPEAAVPAAALPEGVEAGATLTPEEAAAWWGVFGDAALSGLVNRALEGNRTLRGAVAKVREARARLGISRAGLLPEVDAAGAYTRFRNSDTAGVGGDGDRYRAGFDVSWEADVFGRRRREVEASQAAFEAEYATLENAWVSLAAETARMYVQLQTVRQRYAVAQTNLALQAQTFELVASRAKAGLGDELAVEQARYNLERTRASLAGLKAEEEAALNALAVLTGAMPGELREAAGPAPIPAAAPRVLAGIPADLLRRRPDVRAAERRLAAQTARIGVAEADFYPTLRLNGSVGLETLRRATFSGARATSSRSGRRSTGRCSTAGRSGRTWRCRTRCRSRRWRHTSRRCWRRCGNCATRSRTTRGNMSGWPRWDGRRRRRGGRWRWRRSSTGTASRTSTTCWTRSARWRRWRNRWRCAKGPSPDT